MPNRFAWDSFSFINNDNKQHNTSLRNVILNYITVVIFNSNFQLHILIDIDSEFSVLKQ